MKSEIFFALAVCLLAAGCERQESEALQLKRMEAQQADRERKERESFSTSLVSYADGRLVILQNSAAAAQKSLEAVEKDAMALNEIIRNAEDPTKRYLDGGLLRILRDAKVNDLAVKYLSGGFQPKAAELEQRLRDWKMRTDAYDQEMRRNDQQLSASVQASSRWRQDSVAHRNKEIARLEKEVKELERKASTMHSGRVGLAGRNSINEYRKYSYKSSDDYAELQKKRKQLDMLRAEVARYADAEENNQNAAMDQARRREWENASFIHNRNRDNLNRSMRPKESAVDIIAAVRKQTLEALSVAIQRQREQYAKQSEQAAAKVKTLQALKLSIPVSMGAELRVIKKQIDAL